MANEKRIRVNNLAGTLGAAYVAGSGQVNLGAALPAAAVPDATKHLAVTLNPGTANATILYVTGAAISGTTYPCVGGQEGSVDRNASVGAPWEHGPTVRDFSAGRFVWAYDVRGADVTTVSNVMGAVDSSGALDLTIPAQVGDVIIADLSTVLRISNSSDSMMIDAAILDAGGFVIGYLGNTPAGGSGGSGVPSWFAQPKVSGGGTAIAGESEPHVVVAADLAGGAGVGVKLRLMWRVSTAGVTATWFSTHRPVWKVKNTGPQAA